MVLEFSNYVKLVTGTYRQKQRSNDLRESLAHPTRAKLKQESLAVYRNRYHPKDSKVLREFFEIDDPAQQFNRIFRKFDVDKFEPLARYLKNRTTKTDSINIELLAWLIDFKHRPWTFGKDVQLTDQEVSILNEPDETPGKPIGNKSQPDDKITQQPLTAEGDLSELQNPSGDINTTNTGEVLGNGTSKQPNDRKPDVTIIDKQSTRNKRIEIIAAIALSVIFLFLGYSIFQLQKKDCMYWSGDHYEPISCDENIPGKDIIALDEEELKYLTRITKVETITQASVGNVFYKKKNNKLELFTAPGRYPLDRSIRLVKLSQHMYDKYNQKDTVNKVLLMADNP